MANEGKKVSAATSKDGFQVMLGNMKDLHWWIDFLIRNAIYIIIALLVIYTQYYSTVVKHSSNSFLSFAALIDIMKRFGAALFLALGVGGIIVLTGTDLSAGRVVGLTACISASLLQKPLADFKTKMWPDLVAPPIIFVLLLAMAIGCIIGIVNGFCVAKFKLHPFIVTLATQLMIYGTVLTYVTLGRNGGAPISGLTEEYKTVVKGTWIMPEWLDKNKTEIPYYVLYAVIAAAIIWFIWNKSTLGKNMYAVGANPEAANVSGVSVLWTTIFIFMIAGIMYGVGGFVEAARTGSNTALTGDGWELDAIAACVIGGVSFTGGVGKISGVITGVVLIQIIEVSLQWLTVSGNLKYIIKGLIILAACAIDMRKYLQKK